MKRLLLILMLIAVAISGCTEKGPSVANKSAEELKTLSISAAENLTSYSLKSSMTQILKLNTGGNKTPEKVTTVTESAETVAFANLSSLQVHVNGATKNQVAVPDLPANTSTTSVDFYQIGNSTYVNDDSGNWTHLLDPRSAKDVWGPDKNNQVMALAKTFNLSTTADLGSEAINGE
ncbi:MAG: hypothetical protein WCG94_02680, partial [Methanothrix sp.]